MRQEIKKLNKDDVMRDTNPNFLNLSKTFTINDLTAHIETILRGQARYSCDICEDKGHPCEVLQASGGGWQKGQIRISFELLTEAEDVEPTEEDFSLKKDDFSVLDEIRQLNS